MQMSEYSDERLCSLLSPEHAADEFAAELFSRYEPVVKGIASNYFVPGAEAEDVMQEGRIGLFKAVINYDPERSDKFKPFAIMCIKQQIQSAVRKAARKKHIPLNSYVSLDTPARDVEEDASFIAAGGESNPESIFINRESREDISRIINTSLSEKERAVLDLYIKGRTYREIADIIGRNTKYVDNTIQAAKRKLRARIK